MDEKVWIKNYQNIFEFESGLIDLVNYTDELSKEIFDVKSDIQKKYDGTIIKQRYNDSIWYKWFNIKSKQSNKWIIK